MAREVIERLVDDIDGSVATQSVIFAVDGLTYRVDVNDQHAEQLRSALRPYVGVARRVRGESGRRGAPVRGTDNRERNSAIRQWALDEGVQLPDRGRVAGAVQAAYDARDADALYAATGLAREEEEQPPPRRGRRRPPNPEFSARE